MMGVGRLGGKKMHLELLLRVAAEEGLEGANSPVGGSDIGAGPPKISADLYCAREWEGERLGQNLARSTMDNNS
jgi:hypothetical protein